MNQIAPLLDKQKEAISRLNTLKVGALFMKPGTGKTRAAYELIKSIQSDYVIWLTPFQTKSNLLNEIIKCGELENVIIIGIETLSSSDRAYLELYNTVQNYNCFLVVDESLKIKNWEAIRTKRILELAKYCQYKLVLNGTPLARNILDLWAQFEFLSPKILNMGIAEYKSTFCEIVKVSKQIHGVYKSQEYIKDFHNIDYLYSLIKPYVYECDLELSIKQQYDDIPYVIGEEEKIRYNELKTKYLDNEMLAFLNNNIFLEMTMKMQHEYCCAENKFEELEKLLKKVDVNRTIVYTKFISSRLELNKRFPSLEVLSYGKHTLGLNLQKYNITVYFDKTFDYSQMTQSKYRTFRTGQESDCMYYSMTGDVGLEKLINDNIRKKQSILDYFKKVGIEQIKKEI